MKYLGRLRPQEYLEPCSLLFYTFFGVMRTLEWDLPFWPSPPLLGLYSTHDEVASSFPTKKKLLLLVDEESTFFLFPALHEGAFCPFFVRWGSTKSVLGLAQCFLILRDPNSCVL